MEQGVFTNAVSGVVHAMDASSYAEKFLDVSMSQEFAEAVWAYYKTDSSDLSKSRL